MASLVSPQDENFEDTLKTTGPVINTQSFIMQYVPVVGEPTDYGPYEREEAYYEKVTMGQTTPNFWKRKNAGELLPMTEFEQWEIASENSGSYVVIDADGNKLWCPEIWLESNYHGFVDSMLRGMRDTIDLDREMQNLLQSAAAKIYSEGFDAGTFLGEFRELIRMFKGIVQHLIGLVRGKPPNLDWDSWWMGMRYGIRPLIFDIEDFHKTLTEFDAERTRYNKKTYREFSGTDVSDSQYNDGWVEMTTRDETDWTVSIKGHVIADIEPPKWTFNPLLVGWELLTFSFVIDWVFSVGASLAAASFLLISEKHSSSGGWRIDVHTRRTTVSSESLVGGSADCSLTGGGDAYWEKRIPMDVPYLPLNKGVKFLDFNQLRDLLAILRRLLSGGR